MDKEARTIEFVASDATRDSYGTVLLPGNWDLDRFNKNGVIGYQHMVSWSSDPDNVIGKGVAKVEDDKLVVKVAFEPAEINAKAEKIFRKLEFGSLRAVSVGFIPYGGRYGEGPEAADGSNPTYYYDRMELVEVSVVNIPANKNALKRALEAMEQEDPEPQPDHQPDSQPEPEPESRYETEIAMAKAVLEITSTTI